MTESEVLEAVKRLEAEKVSIDKMPGSLLDAGFAAWRAMVERCQEIGRGFIALENKFGKRGLLQKAESAKLKRQNILRPMALARMTIDWNSCASVTRAIIKSGLPNSAGGVVVATAYLKLRAKEG
ncbi:MAG TPA: hypothetical protein VH619_06270 [Verrucomicrobiae bacterium]|jgi:hypothetical protein|nr:hypothetical protein [Verrucomicrobiae bacterium]